MCVHARVCVCVDGHSLSRPGVTMASNPLLIKTVPYPQPCHRVCPPAPCVLLRAGFRGHNRINELQAEAGTA